MIQRNLFRNSLTQFKTDVALSPEQLIGNECVAWAKLFWLKNYKNVFRAYGLERGLLPSQWWIWG